jgi:hypothetical protein
MVNKQIDTVPFAIARRGGGKETVFASPIPSDLSSEVSIWIRMIAGLLTGIEYAFGSRVWRRFDHCGANVKCKMQISFSRLADSECDIPKMMDIIIN